MGGLSHMDGVAPRPGDAELARAVHSFGDARVLVLGDVMLDRYVSGSASRLSPEAPIPVLRPSAKRATLGGAANVALNVATLGGQAALIGIIGEDADGVERRAFWDAAGWLRGCRCRRAPDHRQDALHGGSLTSCCAR
jgi:hypothetical protein